MINKVGMLYKFNKETIMNQIDPQKVQICWKCNVDAFKFRIALGACLYALYSLTYGLSIHEMWYKPTQWHPQNTTIRNTHLDLLVIEWLFHLPIWADGANKLQCISFLYFLHLLLSSLLSSTVAFWPHAIFLVVGLFS